MSKNIIVKGFYLNYKNEQINIKSSIYNLCKNSLHGAPNLYYLNDGKKLLIHDFGTYEIY